MRLRHTSPFLQKVSFLFPFSFFVFCGLLFSACLGGHEAPGGKGPASPPLPGNYGAPPVSIPGPVALNMSAITIVAPDTAGKSQVWVEAGAGTVGNQIQVKNLGDVAFRGPLQRWLVPSAYAAGETLSADIAADGSVVGSLEVSTAPGEWLEFRQCLKSDPSVCSLGYRVEVPATGSVKGTSAVVSTPPSAPKSMKMTVDPKGNVILFEEEAGNKRWDFRKLFISSAVAQEESPGFSVTRLACPTKDGPAFFEPESAEEAASRQASIPSSCKITREIKGKSHRITIPHCRAPKDLQAYSKDADGAVWLAAAAGDTVHFFKEKNPSDEGEIAWVKSLRFLNPVYKVTPSLQNNSPSILVAVKGDPSLVALSPDLGEAACYSSSARELSQFEEMTAFARDPTAAVFYIAARGEEGASILKASGSDGKIMSGGRITTLKSGLLSDKIGSLLYLGRSERRLSDAPEALRLPFDRFAYLDGTNQVVFLELAASTARQYLEREGKDPGAYESIFAWEIASAQALTVMEGNEWNAFAVMEEAKNRVYLFRYWNDSSGNLQAALRMDREWSPTETLLPLIAYDSSEDEFVVRRRDGQVERMRAMVK